MLTDGLKPRVTRSIWNVIQITLTWAERQSGQILEGWLVDHTPCTVQRYSASMDLWQACERVNHQLYANPGVKSDQEV